MFNKKNRNILLVILYTNERWQKYNLNALVTLIYFLFLISILKMLFKVLNDPLHKIIPLLAKFVPFPVVFDIFYFFM